MEFWVIQADKEFSLQCIWTMQKVRNLKPFPLALLLCVSHARYLCSCHLIQFYASSTNYCWYGSAPPAPWHPLIINYQMLLILMHFLTSYLSFPIPTLKQWSCPIYSVPAHSYWHCHNLLITFITFSSLSSLVSLSGLFPPMHALLKQNWSLWYKSILCHFVAKNYSRSPVFMQDKAPTH